LLRAARCRLEDRAFAHQVFAQDPGVGEIAVMRKRDSAACEIGEHRLDVARARSARRRIAIVADREGALELLHTGAVPAAEYVADQTGVALRDELAVVVGDDARGFLAAMLKRMQAKNGQRAGVGMAEDAENAALLVKGVVVGRSVAGDSRHRSSLPPVVSMSLSNARRSCAP
jgi:hypothetical protein